MSSMLNDTIGAARNAVESAKEGTEHAVSSTRSVLLYGLHALSGFMGVLRGLHLDDGLASIGLARRGPLRDVAVFGAGFVAGASAGLLFAPKSGTDTRRTILDELNGLKREAKETVKKAEQKVECKMAEGAEALKDKAQAAAHSLRDRADAIGDTMDKGANTKSLN